MNASQLALVSGAGLLGGFVNSVAGGGSLLLFPALVAGGLGTVSANVTNSVALWPGYVGNVVALGPEHRPGRAQWPVLLTTAIGAGLGCALLLLTPARAFAVVVPFLVIGASLLLAAQPRITRRLGRSATDRTGPLLAGALVGSLYGGYFGGGLGVILMALLGLTVAAPLAHINALKGVMQVVVATVSLVAFALFGPVHWVAAAIIAPLSLAGGMLGGRLTKHLSEPVLRACVVTFGLLVGVWLALRAF
jgi:uncharacterized protein